MVRMIMGEQDGIHTIDTGGDELNPELRRRIDQKPRAVVRFDDGTDPGAGIARVWRPAYSAVAADLRNPETRSRPEEGELQTISTLSRLVLPGTSNGTPAVTNTRSPGRASPRAWAAARASGTTAS